MIKKKKTFLKKKAFYKCEVGVDGVIGLAYKDDWIMVFRLQ